MILFRSFYDKGMIKAFMYHDIRDPQYSGYPRRLELRSFVSTTQFKCQLKFITENYTVIEPQHLKENLKEDCTILTFDDGLKDHCWVAEILYEAQLKATFLIPTLAIRDRKVIKAHKIQFILATISEKKVVENIFDLMTSDPYERDALWNAFSVSHHPNNWWSKEMVFVTNFLRRHDAGDMITDKLFVKFITKDEKDFCSDFYLTPAEVGHIAGCGMTIGSHGYSSKSLKYLNNQEEEIKESLLYAASFSTPPLSFSYPQGSYNDDTVSYAKKHNCEFAYTTRAENITPDTDLLKIPRFDAPQTLPLL
jgi:peptidoglycan/xylan/chitin deacetylase (PgdA/CDA1 family)